MAIDFKVPDLGENVESGDIVSVMVKEGDEIAAEQSVMEIETGKAVVELPCPHAGKITKVHVKKGSKVKVGDALLTIDAGGKSETVKAKPAAAPAAKPEPKAAKPAVEEVEVEEVAEEPAEEEASPAAEEAEPVAAKAAPAKKPAPAAAPAKPAAKKPEAKPTNDKPAAKPAPATNDHAGKTPPAGPATRRLARELGVDLTLVTGSGPNGRISEEDVKNSVREHVAAPRAVSSTPHAALPEGSDTKDQWGPIRKSPMSGIRRAIAQHMAASASTIPHVTNFDDADITEMERIRKGGMADYAGTEVKLTMMAFVMKAVAQSLKLHPLVNSSVDMKSEEIIFKQYVNIGVAVDTDRGLVVPVIRDVDQISIPRIAQALTHVVDQARAAKFSQADLQGGTFTISNLGAVGGQYSTPIINAPEVAVLLLGRSRKMPIVGEGDKIEIRLMMPLSLSYDHRIVDGATAARFLNEVINYLKVPGRLLLAP